MLRGTAGGAAFKSGGLLLALAALACGGPRPVVVQTVEAYIHAVQERNADRLMDLSAGMWRALSQAPPDERETLRQAYRVLLDGRHAAYLQGRDAGRLEFEPDGIVLIRALNLGRGTYYEPVEVEFPEPGRARVVLEVRLAYRSIDVSTLPAGTVIYLLGMPLGAVYHPEIGAREPAARELLEMVWMGWDLSLLDGRWRVERVVPDARPPATTRDTTRF